MTRGNAFRLLGCVLLAGLLVTAAVAQSTGQYQVTGGMISGGSYQLTTVNWQVSGAAGGAGYRLLATEGRAAPALRGSGCCCTYLPCVLRQY